MKCKVTRTQNGFAIEVPPEAGLAEGDAELFESENGACIIVARKEKSANAQGFAEGKRALQQDFVSDENALLKKLSAIKFEDRTPEKVDRLLSENELSILANLIKKKLVNVFYGKKYVKTGVYSIATNAFQKATKTEAGKTAGYEKTQAAGTKMQATENAGANANAQSPHVPNIPIIAELEKNGFCTVENELQARLVASVLQPRIAGGDVLGVRAFDRKYYLATRKFYSENAQKAENALSKPKGVAEVAGEIKLGLDAATVVLHLMCEKGDAIEKRRGLFERA